LALLSERRLALSDYDSLIAAAKQVRENAHAKFSNFKVGAALLSSSGKIYGGCNVENATYGLTICAERVAIFSAVAAGHKRIDALALACIDALYGTDAGGKMPCGACRQVLSEFADPAAPVHVDGVGTLALRDLLPHAFRLV
jgi:cytidine deaminase